MKPVHYGIALDVQARSYVVTLTVPQPAALQVMSLPTWIPGSYLLREFARHLSSLKASQGGREVHATQIDKCTWQLPCQGDEDLVLSYRVHAFDNSVRTAWLDAQRGFFNGTSLCLRVHGREQESHAISLSGLPQRWRVATAMTEQDGGYVAADYDELVDHPFELGDFWEGCFTAGGVEHRFVIAGAMPSFDGERLMADARRICEAQIAFWQGDVPFRAYTFMLNVVDEGHGGLEHRASTALIAPRRDLPRLGQPEQTDGYVRLLSLISHEYFHSWNVKRLRPDVFARYDYTQENYTGLLWFFEGFTSYYDELFLLRAGLIEAQRYLKLLATTVSGVLATPGRHVQSVAQASFDAWTKFYRPDENTPNTTISYYGKGSLVALALDLRLRASGAAGLDALMQMLWRRSGGGPVSEVEILAAVAEQGGAEIAAELGQWVHGTDDLPLRALLEGLAVQWRHEKPTLAQRLGLKVSESAFTGVQVKQVLDGMPARAAGLCAGDEIIGCNGWRLRRLEDALTTLGPGQNELQCLVSRDQRLINLAVPVPAMKAELGPAVLSLDEQAAASALGLRRAWLSAS